MSDFTHYLEKIIVDWMVQGVDAPASHASIYVGLHTQDPGDNPDGTTEVGTADYERYQSASGTDWNESLSGSPHEVENASDFEFVEAQNDWGTISHVSLWDASKGTTGEECIATYALDTSKTINTADSARFSAGDLSFQVD